MTTIDFSKFTCIYDKFNDLYHHKYDIISTFDKSKTCKIYLAKDIVYNLQVIIKTVPKSNHAGLNEINYYKFLNRNITNSSKYFPVLYAVFECSNHYYLVMEHIDGPKFNRETFLSFNISQQLKIIKKICKIVNRLHDVGILINDLKEDNILLDSSNNPRFIDFGMMIFINDESQITKGTPLYMPPEIFKKDMSNEKKDIWALGVILYELYIRDSPLLFLFDVNEPLNDSSDIKSMSAVKFNFSELDNSINEMIMLFDDYCNDNDNEVLLRQIGQIIFKCLAFDPDDRPSIKEILKLL